ncbi:hypothetical protein NBRC10512v2_005078 [Rhodotorula toruloides]
MTSAQRTSGHPRQDKPLATATARLKQRREKREEDAAQVELEAVRRELEEVRKRLHQLLVDKGGGSGAIKVLQKEVGELRAKVDELVATLLTANAERDEFADLLEVAQAKEAEHERRKEALDRLEHELEQARQETAATKQIVALKEEAIRALKSQVEAKQRAKQELGSRAGDDYFRGGASIHSLNNLDLSTLAAGPRLALVGRQIWSVFDPEHFTRNAVDEHYYDPRLGRTKSRVVEPLVPQVGKSVRMPAVFEQLVESQPLPPTELLKRPDWLKEVRRQPLVYSRSPVEVVDGPVRTRRGLPISWPRLDKREGQMGVRSLLKRTDPLKLHQAGVALGGNAIAGGLVVAPAPANYPQPFAEATFKYHWHRTRQLQRQSNQAMSRINNRFSDELASPTPAGPTAGAPGSFYSLQHKGTVAALAHLTSSSPIVSEQRAKAKITKTAETASAAAQFVSLLLGKPAPAIPSAGDGDGRAAIVYVDDTPGKGGFVRGPKSQAPFVRAADVELTRRRVEHLMPVVPSKYTGERCPNPKCVDSGLRSIISPPTYEDGTKETRLGECEVCGLIAAREAVLGANLITRGHCSEVREKRLVKERDELARQLQVVRSKLEQAACDGKQQEQEQIKQSVTPPKQPHSVSPSLGDSTLASTVTVTSDFFDGPKALLAATDGRLGADGVRQLKSDFVIAERYLTRYYHLLDALALSDRDVTNLLLAPETVRHCIAELPAKSLIDFVHKSAKSRLPVSPDAEDRARKYCRLLKKAERDLETAKQRLANRSPNPVQGLDRLESREEVERLRAAVSQKNEEISELARDFEDHSKQGEAQVDDLQERLEQATAELELVRTGATRSNKTTENGDKAAFPISSSFPFDEAAATLDHVGTLLPRLAQIIEELEEENEDLREDAAFLMARQTLQA